MEQIKNFESLYENDFDFNDHQALIYFFEDGEALGSFYSDCEDSNTIEEIELLHSYYSSLLKKDN